MKILICVLIAVIINFAYGEDSKGRKALADSLEQALKGQRKWLKIDVLKKVSLWGGGDITYVLQDTTIQYKVVNNYQQIISTSTDQFVKDILAVSPNETIDLLERGTPVILHSIKFDEKKSKETEIKIGITDEESGGKSAIKFIFPEANYTTQRIQKSFAIAFSDTDWSDESTPRAFAKKLMGQKKWLKIDAPMIRENTQYGGAGAAYIFPDDKIYYKLQYYLGRKEWAYQTESIAELENEVRHRLLNYSTEVWSRGTQVTITAINFVEKWKKSDYHAQIIITNFKGDKNSVKIVFDFNGNNVEKFQRAISIAFANNENELQNTGQTAKLSLGMSIDDVIKMKGEPKTRADLGAKTVLTYDDVKIVFQDGKLVDVQ